MKKTDTNSQAPARNCISQLIVYKPEVVPPSALINILSQSEAVEIRARNMLPSFTFSSDLSKSLNNHISKGHEKVGLLFGTAHSKSKRCLSFCYEYLNFTQDLKEEDITVKINEEECFCASFVLAKPNNHEVFEKFRYQIGRCQQPQSYMTAEGTSDQQFMNELEKVYFQLMRILFIFYSLQQDQCINKIIFFPNINIQLRQTKLTCKYVSSELLDRLIQPISSQSPIIPTFGYLMPDDRSRIVVIERNCKDYSKKPMMGIWIYARDFKKKDTQNLNLEKLHLVWALITDYIRRDKLQKVSMFGEHRGMLILFTPGKKKPTVFIFQCTQQTTSNRWALSQCSSKKADLKEQVIFDTLVLQDNLSVLVDKQQKNQLPLRKQISSPVKKQSSQLAPKRQFPSFCNNSFAKSEADSRSLKQISCDKVSQKSYDEKDVQIRVLRDKVDFYKTRCESLEKLLLNYQSNIQQQQFMPFYHPMIQMMSSMPIGSMNQMNPLNHINISNQLQPPSPMNHLHHSSINASYYPLYNSNIGVQQSNLVTLYASNPQHQEQSNHGLSVMTQSYVVCREELPGAPVSEKKIFMGNVLEQEPSETAFTKKQHTMEGSAKQININNGNYVTPIHKLSSNNSYFSKPESIRVNLAEQFSEHQGSIDSSPNNQNNNIINKPAHINQEFKEDHVENSPKFQFGDLSETESSKLNEKDLPSFPIPDIKQDTLELKGYTMPVPALEQTSTTILTDKNKLSVKINESKFQVSMVDSYASDCQHHNFTSEFVRASDKSRVSRPVDSDDDEDMNVIMSKYRGRH